MTEGEMEAAFWETCRLRGAADLVGYVEALELLGYQPVANQKIASPIERMMLCALGLEAHKLGKRAWRHFIVQPQFTIGPYRADFEFHAYKRKDGKIRPRMGVVVECDGHDFHERTKAQASHDKKRDRYMQQRGFVVLRFSGSDIFRDARGCAAEVFDVAFKRPLKPLKKKAVEP